MEAALTNITIAQDTHEFVSNDGLHPRQENTKYLTRLEASQYIESTYRFACGHCLLAKLASIGGGPARLRSGRSVVYRIDDLDRWALARLQRIEDDAA